MSPEKFRVGLTRDLLTPGGEPSFGKGPLALLDDDPRIEWEYLPESATVITPDIMARYDGLYVNSPAAGTASATIRLTWRRWPSAASSPRTRRSPSVGR